MQSTGISVDLWSSHLNPFQTIPYFPTFSFPDIAAGVNATVTTPIPYSIAVYGIAIAATDLPENSYYEYTIQFLDFETGDTLFDEPIQAFNIQTDCRTYPPPNIKNGQGNGGGFRLPSKWFIKKNTRIVCKLSTFADSTTEDYYVTLLAHTVEADPNPGIQPFIYSYPMRMGFQDNIGGQTSVNFNQQVTSTLAKPMLHDFELHAITLDPWGTNGFGGIPAFSLQISWPNRKLFDRFVINGVAGGGTIFGQGGSEGVGNFLVDDNVWQYVLPKPEIIPKRQIVRVDISPAITYNSEDLHSYYNEQVCMALIGNHLA